MKELWNKAKACYQDFRLYQLASYALNRTTPRKGYDVQHNLAYGLKARQRFDLYRSHQAHAQKPLVVFVHGGAWSTGDKKAYRFLGQALATQGFDVVVMNYHLAPTHIFPSSVDDLYVLMQYLEQHENKLKISSKNIILMGHSAGAFNVMSLLYHPKPYALDLTHIRAVVGLAGPYHFDYFGDPLCQEAFDQTVPYSQIMPSGFVYKNQIRHYLFKAEKDTVVGVENASVMQQALHQVGNHAEIIEVAKTGHVTIVGSLAHWFSPYFSTKKQLLKVLNESLERN